MSTNGEPRSWRFALFAAFVFVAVFVIWFWLPRCFSVDIYAPVNALFSGLAFAGLIIAILLQREELQLQRRELALTRDEMQGQKEQLEGQKRQMEIQNFENRFFQMEAMWNRIRKDIAAHGCYESWLGFHALLHQTRSCIRKSVSRSPQGGESLNIGRMIDDGVKDFHKEAGDIVETYLRTLYSIIKIVDDADIGLANQKFYTEIIRVQLSRPELMVVFYDSLSTSGQAEFKPLIEKYALMKYLDDSDLVDPKHRQFYNTSAFK